MGKTLLAALLLSLALACSAQAAEMGVVFGSRPSGAGIDGPGRTADLGADWVRLFADWPALEPADDQFNESYVKQFVDTAIGLKRDGRKVLAVAFLSPPWASGTSDVRVPPRNPADYAAFVGELIKRTGGAIDAWEIWNEEDDPLFWTNPDPVAYTRLLAGAYPLIKAADPNAIVVSGGLVGNDHDFLRGIYAAGGKGYFDAVGVHTDTACLSAPPTYFYREPDGDIGRYAFTGYREVHQVMAENGESSKPIWMTELGWEATSARCKVPGRTQAAGGVTEAQQAEFLELAYRCMAQDSYMQLGIWFSLQDVDATERHGLIRDSGSNRPSYNAFKSLARGGPVSPPGEYCGGRLDHIAPTVRLLRPTRGAQYYEHLPIEAVASDNQRIARMELYADGVRIPGSQTGGRFKLDWQGARKLGFGQHTITIRAYDEARNFADAATTVVRVNPATLPAIKPRVELIRGRVRSGLRVRVKGRLIPTASPIRPLGRILVEFQLRSKGSWKTRHKYSKGVRKRFDFTARLAGKGNWRVRATFEPSIRPYVRSRSKTLSFRV